MKSPVDDALMAIARLSLSTTRTELRTLVRTWRENAANRDAQPKNRRYIAVADASAAVVYRMCADEIEALLTKGPVERP